MVCFNETNKANFYTDGVSKSSATGTGGIRTTDWDGNLLLGAINNYGSIINELNGKIDEVRIYNRALSATEIKTLYNLFR